MSAARKTRADMPHSLFTALTLVLLIVALPINSALLKRRIGSLSPTRRGKLFRYGRTIVVLWTLTALAAYALRLHGGSLADAGVRMPDAPAELAFGLIVLIPPLIAVLAGATRNIQRSRGILAIVPSGAMEWIAFIAVAASAGICEEFLYRGYALTVIAALTGNVLLGVLASSLAFGFAHAYQGRSGIFGATISGLLFAFVFLFTHSLYPCMIGHFMQDIAGGAILSQRSVGGGQENQPDAAHAHTTTSGGVS